MTRYVIPVLALIACDVDPEIRTVTETVTKTNTVEVLVEEEDLCDPLAVPRLVLASGDAIEDIHLVVFTDGVCDTYELVEVSLTWLRTDYFVFETTVYGPPANRYDVPDNPEVIEDDNILCGGPNLSEMNELDLANTEIKRYGTFDGNDATKIEVIWDAFVPVLLNGDVYELDLDTNSQEFILTEAEYRAIPRVLLNGPDGEFELTTPIDFSWPFNPQ